MCSEKPRAQARHAVARAATNMALGVPAVATHDAPTRFHGLRHSGHAHSQNDQNDIPFEHVLTIYIDTGMIWYV